MQQADPRHDQSDDIQPAGGRDLPEMAERPHYRRFPAWFAEDTHEWTVVERMRYDLAEVNDAHAWNTSTTAVRAIADFLRIDADGVL